MIRKLHYFLTHSPEKETMRFGVSPTNTCAMRRALWKYGMYYEEFLLFDCAGKDDTYLSSFITERNRYEIYRKYNDNRTLPLFHDKYRVYQLYHEFYHREVVPLYSSRDRAEFLAFAARHSRFIVKPSNKSCGYGVQILDTAVQSPEVIAQALLHTGKHICESLVPPHPDIARLNPTSLNTVRAVTILEGNTVHIFYPFLRVGRYGSVVDNGGAGGILIPIDPKTGRLHPIGRDEAGRYYTTHPDSHVKFSNIGLPMWDKAIHLVQRLAHVYPDNRCIGWDIAVTPEDWVMIEANIRGQFIGQQMVDRIGKRYELLKSKPPVKLVVCTSPRRAWD